VTAVTALYSLDPLQLVSLQLPGVAWLGSTEILLVLECVLGRGDRFADGPDLLQCLVEILARFLQPVREEALDVLLLIAVEGAGGVVP